MKNQIALISLFLAMACTNQTEFVDQPNADELLLQTEPVNVLTEIAHKLSYEGKLLDYIAGHDFTKNYILKIDRGIIGEKDYGPAITMLSDDGQIIYRDVIVEMDFRSPLKFFTNKPNGRTKASFPYRIALDPDEYYFPADVEEEDLDVLPTLQIPTFYYNGTDPEPIEEIIDINEYTEFLEPIFFLAVAPSSSEVEIRANNRVLDHNPLSGDFLVLNGIRLKKKKDNSNEEFELYDSFFGEDPIGAPFQGTTHQYFDGTTRHDYSNRERYYLNVEKSNSIQRVVPGQQIAIHNLPSNYEFRICAIEDDNKGSGGQGIFERKSWTSPIYNPDLDYYNMASDVIQFNTNSAYRVGGKKSKNDDRYDGSGIRHISKTNLLIQIGGGTYMQTDAAINGGLGAVNYELGFKAY